MAGTGCQSPSYLVAFRSVSSIRKTVVSFSWSVGGPWYQAHRCWALWIYSLAVGYFIAALDLMLSSVDHCWPADVRSKTSDSPVSSISLSAAPVTADKSHCSTALSPSFGEALAAIFRALWAENPRSTSELSQNWPPIASLFLRLPVSDVALVFLLRPYFWYFLGWF